uniref:Uncharacterized protein n=1 Tax=Romanomermis culicivorax TaxID=13658 RepID=A0A915KGA4_ROMCU
MWSRYKINGSKNAAKDIFTIFRRNLNLQEYSSKELLRENGINVQRFVVVDSAKTAKETLKTFSELCEIFVIYFLLVINSYLISEANEYVVKAQILAGGRGKGHFTSGLKGGVKVTKNSDEVFYYVEKMVGHKLITNQTGKDGVLVKKVMIAESANLTRETYVAILMDRENQGPVIVVSPAGGMDIEDVAQKTPNLIFKVMIDKIGEHLRFRQVSTIVLLKMLSNFFPLLVLCVDAKLNFDDSASYRQTSVFSMDDKSETDEREINALNQKLNYVGLDGNIGCLVNGAGLAMATMDIIKLHGGQPANFLDVGGSVQEEQVYQAFKIITSDIKVGKLSFVKGNAKISIPTLMLSFNK